MTYSFTHEGNVWNGKFFAFPEEIVDRYIKLASEYELKVLLIILRNGGSVELGEIASILGITKDSVNDIMKFWISEGLVITSENSTENVDKKNVPLATEYVPNNKIEFSSSKTNTTSPVSKNITAPNLSQTEIVMAAEQNPEIADLLNEAQNVFGYTLKTSEQELIVNLVNFYGLKAEIVLVILQYYQNEKNKGRSIGLKYVAKVAENWSDEGIDTVEAAEEKCKEIEQSDSFWRQIASSAGISFKAPSINQRQAILTWKNNLNMDIIEYAIDIMKDNCSHPSFRYLNTILSNWINAGVKTLKDAEKEQQMHHRKEKRTNNSNRIQIASKPTYDINLIEQNAMQIKPFKLDE